MENELDYSVKSIRNKFKEKGVFYTDTKLAEIIKGYIDIPFSKVYDPTCGSGNLLSVFDETIEKVGQEIDEEQANVARERLDNCRIYVGDTLTNPCNVEEKFDVIVANPPFSIKWDVNNNPERFKINGVIPPQSKADYAFILHCLQMLSDNGMALILCFPGVLYRGNAEGMIREWLVENNLIERIVRIPKGFFVDTNIETALMVLRRGKKSTDVIFEDLLLGKDRTVSFDEIKSNDFVLSTSGYVFEEKKVKNVDPMELQRKARNGMLHKLQKDIDVDIQVCELEGWSVEEYIKLLQELINKYKEL